MIAFLNTFTNLNNSCFFSVLQIYLWVQIYALYQLFKKEELQRKTMAKEIQQVSDEIEHVPEIRSSQNDLVALV